MKNTTKLFELSDYEIENEFTELRQAAGYDDSTQNVINQIRGWNMTVEEFEEFLEQLL